MGCLQHSKKYSSPFSYLLPFFSVHGLPSAFKKKYSSPFSCLLPFFLTHFQLLPFLLSLQVAFGIQKNIVPLSVASFLFSHTLSIVPNTPLFLVCGLPSALK